jgi:hypothetical protein
MANNILAAVLLTAAPTDASQASVGKRGFLAKLRAALVPPLVSLPTLLGPARKALVVAAIAVVAAVPYSQAEAYSYPKNVYPPERYDSTTVEGWADVQMDASGTVGTWIYTKIERRNWWGGADFVNGGWTNKNGWNSMKGTMSRGCQAYRTTVDVYNDVIGPWGAGVNGRQVGGSANGQTIYRYRTTWSSGYKTHCR